MLDTTVLLAGIVWPRFAHEVLQHALRADFELVMSPTVVREARRKFAGRFAAFSQDFEDLVRSIPYEPTPEPSSDEVRASLGLMRDATDVPIALAAIGARVDYFVSDDKDFTTSGESTSHLHGRLSVLLPGAFLREVMGWTSEELEAIRHRRWADLTVLSGE